jgi:hypothetical protein
MSEDSGYLLDNRAAQAGERFAALAEIFDASTFRHIDALGIGRGGRCWEVGAGGESIVRGLAARVGAEGRVLATDIELGWARGATAMPNVEVSRHDVGRDDPPAGGGFDLVHARLVLVHVPERERALGTMVAATRPGGWVMVEDADPALQPLACIDPAGPEQELANRVRAGLRTLLAGRGADLAYGRKLPRLLRAAGLVDVAADAYFPVAHPACARLEMATVNLIRDRLLEAGVVTAAEIDRHLASVAAGRLDLAQPPMITAWGRRPLAGAGG